VGKICVWAGSRHDCKAGHASLGRLQEALPGALLSCAPRHSSLYIYIYIYKSTAICTLTQLYIYTNQLQYNIYIAVDLSHLNRGITLKPCAGCGVAAIAQVWSTRAIRVSEVTAGLPATHLAAGRSQRSLQGQPAQYSEGSALCSYHFHRIRVYSWCPDSTCRNGVG
jgi:hypothetical protein